MDIFDSDLSDVSEAEFDQTAPILPYQYGPTTKSAIGSSYTEEDSSSTSSFEADDEPIPDVSTWLSLRCKYNKCQNMPTLIEARCCESTNVVDGKLEDIYCITEHEGFIANCLNLHVLEVAYYDHVLHAGPPEENQRTHELNRHIAYRSFIRWIYGLLASRGRKIIPSCAVVAIRNAFPPEEYCGFKYPQ